MTSTIEVRVYYEDTDLAGIVYYANYLKFIERGRTEFVRGAGIDQGSLKTEDDIVFAVRSINAKYLTPARFDDVLQVRTELVKLGAASVDMQQDIFRGETLVFSAHVGLVSMTSGGKPKRIPADLRASLGQQA